MRRRLIAGAKIVGVAIAALLVVILVRAWRYGASKGETPVQQAGAPRAAVDSGAVGRLSAAVRIPTVTYADSSARIPQFKKLHALLERSFPLVHSHLKREVIDSGGFR